MTTVKYIHEDACSLLWRCRVTANTRTYTPVNWGATKARILHAYQSQDFSGVLFLLVKTGHERYYPIPRLLNLKESVPYFAEESMERIIEALEWEFGVPLPERAP